MLIDNLIIRQESLRNPEQLSEMILFINSGGSFTEKIILSQFPDSKLVIHDGHHRLCAIYLSGRTFFE